MKETFPLEELLLWFLKNNRNFPWREDRTPYKIWVSEVMLQQTVARVVVPYFHKWMERFPSIKDLAQAYEEEVIKAWEGLGLYSRARNLHRGAKIICQWFNGTIPDNPSLLSSIKGIGPYTKKAILAFSFNQKVAPVDGNVLRLFCRFFDIRASIDLASTKNLISDLAEEILPEKNPREAAEAFIELGALICSKNPKCGYCPIKDHCKGFALGIQKSLPKRHPRKETIKYYRLVVVLLSKGKYWVIKRKEGEIMGGLYEFPYLELEKNNITDNPKKLEKLVKENLNIECNYRYCLPKCSHSFTHFRATLYPVVFEIKNFLTEYTSFDLIKLQELPFSSGHKKVLKNLLSLYNQNTII